MGKEISANDSVFLYPDKHVTLSNGLVTKVACFWWDLSISHCQKQLKLQFAIHVFYLFLGSSLNPLKTVCQIEPTITSHLELRYKLAAPQLFIMRVSALLHQRTEMST